MKRRAFNQRESEAHLIIRCASNRCNRYVLYLNHLSIQAVRSAVINKLFTGDGALSFSK